MIEQNPRTGKHAVGFAVVSSHIEAGHFGDAVWRAGIESCFFGLRHILSMPEHFAGARTNRTLLRAQFRGRIRANNECHRYSHGMSKRNLQTNTTQNSGQPDDKLHPASLQRAHCTGSENFPVKPSAGAVCRVHH